MPYRHTSCLAAATLVIALVTTVTAQTTRPTTTAPAREPHAANLPMAKPVPVAPHMAEPKPGLSPTEKKPSVPAEAAIARHGESTLDYWSMVFVFMLATFIGVGVIRRVSRLLHTPLMSLTNAISAIAVVGSIVVAGDPKYPTWIRILGAVALGASMTNIVSGFLITYRMLKMFKTREGGKP
jgi:H+-translocating NAD(P) transhydrogenase subunit alpha